MNTNIITYLACICFLFVFGRIFILPLKKIVKLVFNSVLGGITIFVINFVGATFGFHIGLNFFTSILIRLIRVARGCLFGCCEIANLLEDNNKITGMSEIANLRGEYYIIFATPRKRPNERSECDWSNPPC